MVTKQRLLNSAKLSIVGNRGEFHVGRTFPGHKMACRIASRTDLDDPKETHLVRPICPGIL